MNRRGFLGLLSGAIAVATTGITPAPPRIPQPGDSLVTTNALRPRSPTTYVDARHIYWYEITENRWMHRIDVLAGRTQWGVDFITEGREVDPDRHLAPMLYRLEHALEDSGYSVGQIFTYTRDEWDADPNVNAAWRARQLEAFKS